MDFEATEGDIPARSADSKYGYILHGSYIDIFIIVRV